MSIFIEDLSLAFSLLLITSLATSSQQTCKSVTDAHQRSLLENYQLKVLM